jgi:hypothetical protein
MFTSGFHVLLRLWYGMNCNHDREGCPISHGLAMFAHSTIEGFRGGIQDMDTRELGVEINPRALDTMFTLAPAIMTLPVSTSVRIAGRTKSVETWEAAGSWTAHKTQIL